MPDPSPIAPGAGAGEEEERAGFIGGFPADYRANRPVRRARRSGWGSGIPSMGAGVAPQYKTGDEWQPSSWNPRRILDIQNRLFGAGLIDPDDTITPGRWDPTTRKAYRALLEYSNGAGLDYESALEDLLSMPFTQEQDEGRERAPFQSVVSNPDDLRRAGGDLAQQVLGSSDVDPAAMNKIVSGFQGLEAGAQRQEYDTQESGGTVTRPPDFETYAGQELRKLNPLKADARKALSAFDFVAHMFRGGEANTNVG